jgi:hypothetical protein
LLVERFYRSVSDASPPPIPYREIVLTARLMDTIFAQYRAVGSRSFTAKPQQKLGPGA